MSSDARRSALAAIIRAEQVSSQDQLAARLREAGFEVTQATVSRDLEAIGATRGKRAGRPAYLVPDPDASSLERMLAEWVVATELAGNLIVVRTRPGSAHVVGAALDEAALAPIAGTIAGDDTLFVAVRDGHDGRSLARQLSAKGLPKARSSR